MTTTDRVKTLELQIKALSTRIAKLATDLAAVNDKTRRGGGTLDFSIAGGAQTLDVVWSKPFPDTQYGVIIQTSSASPAQVHAIPLYQTRTAAGITVQVNAGTTVGAVIVEVQASRSA